MMLWQGTRGGNVRLLWLAFALTGIAIPAQAQSDSIGGELTNVYSLSASASAEAINDLMRASVVVQHTNEDSALLADKINADMQWAMSRLKPFVRIKSKTTNYQTYPTYDRKHKNIIGWRASQTLELETDDVEGAGEAIRILQERLQVTGIRFEPKTDTRRAMEDRLINEALDAFKQRAQLIRLNMGKPGYTILNVDVQTESRGGGNPQPYHRSEVSFSSQEYSPALEGGTSEITVYVNGRVQLGVPQ